MELITVFLFANEKMKIVRENENDICNIMIQINVGYVFLIKNCHLKRFVCINYLISSKLSFYYQPNNLTMSQLLGNTI